VTIQECRIDVHMNMGQGLKTTLVTTAITCLDSVDSTEAIGTNIFEISQVEPSYDFCHPMVRTGDNGHNLAQT
jgi:hypothetical protein